MRIYDCIRTLNVYMNACAYVAYVSMCMYTYMYARVHTCIHAHMHARVWRFIMASSLLILFPSFFFSSYLLPLPRIPRCRVTMRPMSLALMNLRQLQCHIYFIEIHGSNP